MEKKEPINCKGCVYGDPLYLQEKDNRYESAHKLIGYVKCSGPRYKNGRYYFCKDTRKACGDYLHRERTG